MVSYRHKAYPWETIQQAQARITGKTTTASGEQIQMPGDQVSTTRTTFEGGTPQLPKIPTFEAPTLDKRAVRAETQREASGQIRRLRDVTSRALGARFDNPNVRRMTVREALQGYGSGVSSILQGSRRAALQTALPEYSAQVGAAQRTYEANVGALMNEYQGLWNRFLRSGTTTTTTRKV